MFISRSQIKKTTTDKKSMLSAESQGRCFQKRVEEYQSGTWNEIELTRFLYDDWNLIAEYDATSGTNTLSRTYTWGLDLSQTPQGAGGVGGLLSMTDGANSQTFYYAFDANGNVTQLIDESGNLSYILVTDHDTEIEELVQCYCDRWQIEVNHRDEKQHIGIADAQVWNDESVDRLPAFLVCTYAMLMLATLEAYGPTRTLQYQTPPKWQNKRRKRPSCVVMLRKLREEASQSPRVEQEVGFQVDLTHILLRAA